MALARRGCRQTTDLQTVSICSSTSKFTRVPPGEEATASIISALQYSCTLALNYSVTLPQFAIKKRVVDSGVGFTCSGDRRHAPSGSQRGAGTFKNPVTSSEVMPVPLTGYPKHGGIHPMLFQCWTSVEDAGSTLKQHWMNTPWLPGCTPSCSE